MEFLRQFLPKLHFHCKCLADVDIEEAEESGGGSRGNSLHETQGPSRDSVVERGPCDPTWAPS